MTSLLAVSLVGSLCVACQWVAWRFRLPAIVLLYEEVMERLRLGWKIKVIRMSDEYSFSLCREKMGDRIVPLLSLTPGGIVVHAGAHVQPEEKGYSLMVLASEV